jgi:hypothetical protein
MVVFCHCPRPIQDEMRLRRGLTRGAARWRADESEPFHPRPWGSRRFVSLHRDLAAHHAMMAGVVDGLGYTAAMDSGALECL